MTQLSMINYSAILLAAAAGFIFGGVWYGIFAARSGGDENGRSAPTALLLVITFIAQVVMAVMLSGILVHVTRSGIPFTLRSGLFSAAMIWIGFVITTLAASNALHGAPFSRTLVDGGYWLGVLLIQAAVLVFMTA
ncbi:MAG TPA: DUF1761 domain-containing protein [Hyphomicrobiaceae bacterium]|nr:DUF1761 domain-containing protein [Hyphomicrobiaceae bacterium]